MIHVLSTVGNACFCGCYLRHLVIPGHDNWENLSFLWNKMTSVRNVRLTPTFTKGWGGKFDGSEFSKFVTLKEGDSKILEERVLEYVNFFRREELGPISVQIDPTYSQRVGGSVDVIKACQKRLTSPLRLEIAPYVPRTGWVWDGFDPTV